MEKLNYHGADKYRQQEKDNFLAVTNKQIAVYNRLIAHASIVIEQVRKFDGKVLNIRLSKAVQAELDKEFGEKCTNGIYSTNHAEYRDRWISLTDRDREVKSYSYSFNGEKTYNWLRADYDEIRLPIVVEIGERINAEKSVEQMQAQIDKMKERIKVCETSIAQYDECRKDAEELSRLIKEYSDKYDFALRRSEGMKIKNAYLINH